MSLLHHLDVHPSAAHFELCAPLQELEQEEEEVVALKWTIVLSLICLVITFLIAHYFESIDFPYLPEAGVAVLLGMIAAGIFYAASGGSDPEEVPEDNSNVEWMMTDMKFDFEFFMIWLLPPIIFEAGYNMNRSAFFENIVPTMLYAFLGTLLSTFVVGGGVYFAGGAGLCHPIGGLASLFFGALISATDPVTVLAVFQALGVKVELFSMVFGESVMNDAVAIVLSRTLLQFKTQPADGQSVGAAVLLFCQIFAGSLIIGVVYGLISSYIYKKAHLSHHADALFVESVMIAAIAWAAYYTAEALELSGIVAILFCGIVMAKYTRDNLSEGAKELTARLFKCVALMAETFVFVYLGMAAFAFPIWDHTTWSMVLVALVCCFVGRLHIYLFSFITNACFRSSPNSVLPPISTTYMHVMWFSGLRGGVAFAIAAVGFQHKDFPNNNDSLAILQTTLVIALFTIFVMGGTITDIAKSTGILNPKGHKAPKLKKVPLEKMDWMSRFDHVTLRPFLTNHSADDDDDDDDDVDHDALRVAAVSIQRSWRYNSPSAKRARVAASTPSGPGKTAEEIKMTLQGGMSFEDKIDSLRVKVPSMSSDELRKILKQCNEDEEAAYKTAVGQSV